MMIKTVELRNIKGLFFFFCFLTLVLLNGCSTTGHKDGPPSFDVDVSRIPDAVPKNEPRSKYGNYATYRVFGRAYHTMASSKNYEERGIASWYGTKFHAQRTSSGEPYDMLAMTAAHKTLPLPTYVQVTNLKNGRKIIVKVNDRGPFESNRLIDLSYVAAKKLGMLGHGTTYVDVKAIDPNNRPSDDGLILAHKSSTWAPVRTASVSSARARVGVYLQIGAFQNRVHAERLKSKIANLVSSPIHITQLANDSRRLYRVQIGPIQDIIKADSITKRLKSMGISSERMTV